MAGINLPATVSSIVPTEMIAQARLFTESSPVARQFIKNYPFPKNAGKTLQLPKVDRLSAYQITAGSTIDQLQTLTTTNVQLTPIWVATHIAIHEETEIAAKESVKAIGSKALTNAIVRFIDVDLLDLCDGFSTTVGAGSTPKIGHLFDAKQTILGHSSNPSMGPFTTFMHPFSYNSIAYDVAGLDTTNKVLQAAVANRAAPGDGSLRDGVLTSGTIRELDGMTLVQAGNLRVSSNVAKGAVMANDALAFSEFRPVRLAAIWREEDLAWHLYISVAYARGEFVDNWGVELNWGAASPI